MGKMKCETCGQENVDGARFCASCGHLLPTEHVGGDPLIGQIVGGRYRVTRVLGEGGMGVVYEGEQQMGTTVRKVAIKTLHQHLSKDPSVVARFNRECATVVQLEHPNTIKFYDFGTTADGALYIAMEFVRGKPLSDVISTEGPLPTARVLKIMRQTCGALDEAHRQNVIHRDLKPDNVILAERAGEKDFVKVLDFGIAARSESADAQKEQKLTQQGMVLGTPPYMSPEQFTGKALDARSDIYSLAVMVYEMLTGKLPFEADTPWQWATEHMSAQPRPFDVAAPGVGIPGGMRAAVLKALSKDPAQRQTSAKQFYDELSSSEPAVAPGAGAVDVSAKTAAMAQAPDFGAVAAPAVMAGPTPGLPAQMATPPAVAQVPASHTRTQGGKGGKGLIAGLAVVGIGLLVAMAVVAARSMKPAEEPMAPPLIASTNTGVATIAPQIESTAAAKDESPPEPLPPPPADTGAARRPSTAKSPSTPKTGTVSPPKSGAATATATAQENAPKQDACEICRRAATSGNVQAAAAQASKCLDSGGKAKCVSSIRRAAPRAIRSAVNNGKCSQAKALAAAAEAIGAGSPGIKAALGNCK